LVPSSWPKVRSDLSTDGSAPERRHCSLPDTLKNECGIRRANLVTCSFSAPPGVSVWLGKADEI